MFAPNNIWYVFIGKVDLYICLAHEISIDIRFPHFFAWNFISTLVHLMSWAHKYYRRSVGLNCKELEYIRSIIQIRWRQQKWLWLAFTPFWFWKCDKYLIFPTHFCHSVSQRTFQGLLTPLPDLDFFISQGVLVGCRRGCKFAPRFDRKPLFLKKKLKN